MKWHPFKMRVVHKFKPQDPERRVNMALTLLPVFMAIDVLSNVVFTDECIFKTNGRLNRQNTRFDWRFLKCFDYNLLF